MNGGKALAGDCLNGITGKSSGSGRTFKGDNSSDVVKLSSDAKTG